MDILSEVESVIREELEIVEIDRSNEEQSIQFSIRVKGVDLVMVCWLESDSLLLKVSCFPRDLELPDSHRAELMEFATIQSLNDRFGYSLVINNLFVHNSFCFVMDNSIDRSVVELLVRDGIHAVVEAYPGLVLIISHGKTAKEAMDEEDERRRKASN